MRLPRTQKFVRMCAVVGLILGLAACGKFFPEEKEIPQVLELSAGTELFVRPVTDLAQVKAGDAFAGVLAEPLHYRRELIDPQGRVFDKKYIVAAKGATVTGEVESVGKEDAPEGPQLTLRLTEVTFHGGMSFPVKTAPVSELAAKEGVEEPLLFKLSEPADIALVIDLRKEEEEQAKGAGKTG